MQKDFDCALGIPIQHYVHPASGNTLVSLFKERRYRGLPPFHVGQLMMVWPTCTELVARGGLVLAESACMQSLKGVP